jgi:hypothetical protein
MGVAVPRLLHGREAAPAGGRQAAAPATVGIVLPF